MQPDGFLSVWCVSASDAPHGACAVSWWCSSCSSNLLTAKSTAAAPAHELVSTVSTASCVRDIMQNALHPSVLPHNQSLVSSCELSVAIRHDHLSLLHGLNGGDDGTQSCGHTHSEMIVHKAAGTGGDNKTQGQRDTEKSRGVARTRHVSSNNSSGNNSSSSSNNGSSSNISSGSSGGRVANSPLSAAPRLPGLAKGFLQQLRLPRAVC